MLKKREAARVVLIRYIITNLLILLIPLLISIVYYAVSTGSLEKSINSIVEQQLERNIHIVDLRLKGLTEQSTQLLVDYDLNRYLNMGEHLSDIDLYNTRRISSRLSSIVMGSDFLSRSYIYLSHSDNVIMDNGFSDYSSFYGPLFAVEGYDKTSWKETILKQADNGPTVMTGLESSVGGQPNPSHFYIKPIGKGNFFRGTFVAVINTEDLGRTLTHLPGLYGGWILVTDESENFIACSSLNDGLKLTSLLRGKQSLKKLIINDQTYRMYSLTSSYNQWNYTALMNENLINADLIRVRNTALFLLLIAFLIGVTFSYLMAFSNSRPLARLFSILTIPAESSLTQVSAFYSHLEQSIQTLAETKNELEREVKSATVTTQTYFLQSLLRGDYHNRARFAEDRDRFSIVLATGPYFIIVCRLSALALALDTRNHGEIMTALMQRLSENIKKDEYALQASSGSLAIMLRVSNLENYRAIAGTFINKIQGDIVENLKENLLFGIGRPCLDPFLLPLSYNEAEASNLSIGPEERTPIRFYEDFPFSNFTHTYPLHVEEAICRAVRGANEELLHSLLNGLKEENLIKRSLGRQEAENLILALRGTALRLINEFPEDMSHFIGKLNTVITNPRSSEAFDQIAEILDNMSRFRGKGKKSHNDRQAIKIREYITDNFRDFNLGLSSIAERFDLSENYLSSFFKEQEGEGLSNYIQRIRMTEASTLLAHSQNIAIDKISANCGYPNTSSFRRAFKRVYGVSPSEFRNQQQPTLRM